MDSTQRSTSEDNAPTGMLRAQVSVPRRFTKSIFQLAFFKRADNNLVTVTFTKCSLRVCSVESRGKFTENFGQTFFCLYFFGLEIICPSPHLACSPGLPDSVLLCMAGSAY